MNAKKSMIPLLACMLLLSAHMLSAAAVTAAPAAARPQAPSQPAAEDGNEMDCTRNMKLPQATRKRLDGIYQRIYKDYVDMINTYTRAGALTQKQRQIRLKMLQNYIYTTANSCRN